MMKWMKMKCDEVLLETLSAPQHKYKEEGKKELSSSLYSQLPETTETQLAKTVHEFQSEVLEHVTAVTRESLHEASDGVFFSS